MLLTICKSCGPWQLSTFLTATSYANPTQGASAARIAKAPSSQPPQPTKISQEHTDERVVAIRRYLPAVPQKREIQGIP